MMSIAKTILTGGKLWGKLFTKQYPVLYVTPENSDAGIIHRIKKLRIPSTERFLWRTMSSGKTLSLSSDIMLTAVKGRVVFLDTLVRFTEGRDEQNAKDMAELGELMLALLRSGAVAVVFVHHSPKSSGNEGNEMTLENVFRGSGDIGSILSAAHGVRKLDESKALIHIECVKPRDFEPLKPFQLEGKPWIDDEGDFRRVKEQVGTVVQEKRKIVTDSLTSEILAVIKKTPGLSGNQIAATVGGRRETVLLALRAGKGKSWKERSHKGTYKNGKGKVISDGYFEID
jgi:hypothetical protein